MAIVKFAKLRDDAEIPKYSHEDDSGFDFICLEEAKVTFGEVTILKTGLAVEMPYLPRNVGIGAYLPYRLGMELQIRSKSGLSVKYGITVANGIGTIDFGYTGEICVALTKVTPGVFYFVPGMKMAQGVFAPIFCKNDLFIKEVKLESFRNSTRGDGGFGSTGT